MSEQIYFYKGTEANLPNVTKKPGALYHCTDTGNTYLATANGKLELYSNTFIFNDKDDYISTAQLNADTLDGFHSSDFITPFQLQNELEKVALEVDESLSLESSNPISNKVVAAAIESIPHPIYVDEDSISGGAETINADTLNGLRASDFALNSRIDALNYPDVNAAPGGYGLGSTCKVLNSSDDLNTIVNTGWYAWANEAAPANAPINFSGVDFQCCRIVGLNTNSCFQEVINMSAYYSAGGTRIQRVVINGNAQEWEWINPPMALNVGYRTTERTNEKAVYIKLIEVTIPEANKAAVRAVDESAESTGAEKIISWTGYIQSGTDITGLPLENNINNQNRVWGYGYNNKMVIWNNGSAQAGKTAKITVKYTKD